MDTLIQLLYTKREFDLVQQLMKKRRPNNGRITTSKDNLRTKEK